MSEKTAVNTSGTPEQVALDMLKHILAMAIERPNTTEEFLALYLRCLDAAYGRRR